jgi:hypothetical protein
MRQKITFVVVIIDTCLDAIVIHRLRNIGRNLGVISVGHIDQLE